MKHLLVVAALICCVTPAIAEDRLTIGTIMTLPTERLRSVGHKFYGCNDVENTKEIARLRSQNNEFVDHAMGGHAADRFVHDHHVSCVELPAKIKWKVVRIEDWAGGPQQLVCVAPMETFDVGQQAEASPAPRDEPSCWWVNIPNK